MQSSLREAVAIPASWRGAPQEALEHIMGARIRIGQLGIRPIVHGVLPIRRVEDAHAILHRRENIGKVVLQIRDAG